MAIFSLEEVPPRTRMPAHPKNRDKDPESYDRYIEYLKNEQIRDSINKEKDKIKLEQKIENKNKAADELNRRKNVVMTALNNQVKNTIFTNKEYKEAIDKQIEVKAFKIKDTNSVICPICHAIAFDSNSWFKYGYCFRCG